MQLIRVPYSLRLWIWLSYSPTFSYYLPVFVFVRPSDDTASRTVFALKEVMGSVPKETTRMIMMRKRSCPPTDKTKSEREKSYITTSAVFILYNSKEHETIWRVSLYEA